MSFTTARHYGIEYIIDHKRKIAITPKAYSMAIQAYGRLERKGKLRLSIFDKIKAIIFGYYKIKTETNVKAGS